MFAKELITATSAWQAIKEVFPSIVTMEVDPEAEDGAVLHEDGSIVTYGKVTIRDDGTTIHIDFGRESRRAFGELACRLIQEDIDFKFRQDDEWLTPEAIQIPLHPEMGRTAWDEEFRQSHPELSWVFPPTRRRATFYDPKL